MAAQCADNSTECLLRALILATETQQDRWSLPSFAVTLIIGVAAALISIATVFQGLLAAGPGRVKASYNAIGAFSENTRGRMSWQEVAWRTTAKVPAIRLADLRDTLTNQLRYYPKHGIDMPFEAGPTDTTASWLHLLKCTGLDEDIETTYKDKLQPCATDFLPADIQAPPASIQLALLAVLASIADPTVKLSLKMSQLTIDGQYSTIAFRQHPVLGALAAYEKYPSFQRYEVTSRNPKAPPPWATLGRCTSHALETARGVLSIVLEPGRNAASDEETTGLMDVWATEGTVRVIRWPESDKEKPDTQKMSLSPIAQALVLMVARTDYEVRPFPWELSGMSLSWLKGRARKHLKNYDVFLGHLQFLGCEQKVTMGQNFDNRDIDKDMTFEILGSWIVPHSSHLIDGNFDPEFCKHAWTTISTKILDESGDKELGDNVNPRYAADRRIEQTIYYLKHFDIILRRWRRDARVMMNMLTERLLPPQIIVKTPQDGTAASNIPPRAARSKASLRSCSPDSMVGKGTSSRVPQQARTRSPPAAVTSTPRSSTSSSPSVGVRASLQLSNSSSTSSTSSHAEPQDPFSAIVPKATNKDQQLKDALECALILRAYLYAVLLAAGPDTSILQHEDFPNVMVKVI